MKQTVLRIFSLILLVLVTCTILSAKIEEEMTLEAIGWSVKASYSDVDVPQALLFTDEEGLHAYEIYEGTGWESGFRAREIDGIRFTSDRDYIVVRGASRQPVYGELAQLYDGNETAPATYLVYYPQGIPEKNDMLFQAEILEQSSHVLLLHVENGIQPFTENRAKNGLIQLAGSGWKLYSMEALTQFLENIPMSAVVFAILWALAVLAVYTVLLSRRPEGPKACLWLNSALIVSLLGALLWALGQIDFPASMLPSETIFDFAHYRKELTAINQVLEDLGSETTRTYAALQRRVLGDAAMILAAGAAAPLLVVLLQQLFMHRRRAKKKKYVGKFLSICQT